MRRVKTRTGKDGGKYKIIYDDGKPTHIKQEIIDVGKDMMKVKSTKGKEYWVVKSDRVMAMNPKVGDVAVILTLDGGWIVTDVLNYVEPVEEDVDDVELERQLKEFSILGGGY